MFRRELGCLVEFRVVGRHRMFVPARSTVLIPGRFIPARGMSTHALLIVPRVRDR